jgi:hypothetical protein
MKTSNTAVTISETGWTDGSAFARQRQEPILATRSTLEPQESAGQDFARQVRPHLAFDKLRNLAPTFLPAGEKGFQMARDRPIQQRVFRIAWPIPIFVIRFGSNARMISSPHGPARSKSHTAVVLKNGLKMQMLPLGLFVGFG